MASLTNGSHVLFLFGPQALSFNEERSILFQTTLATDSNQKWILETLSELHSYWEITTRSVSSLRSHPGSLVLLQLKEWTKTGSLTQIPFPLPNILLTPLVVAFQLSQYLRYLENACPQSYDRHQTNLASLTNPEAVGFCTGVLTAMAVSSSSNDSQLQQNGAIAIRVAMLIGAIVDAQDSSGTKESESRSLSVGWNSPAEGEQMIQLLEGHPDAYISVLYDEKRVTVTTSESKKTALTKELKEAGLTVTDVSLRGRFHFNAHRENIEALEQFCDSNAAFRLPVAPSPLITLHLYPPYTIRHKRLHSVALRSILVEQFNWYKTLNSLKYSSLSDFHTTVYFFGLEQCIPPTIVRKMTSRIVQAADIMSQLPPSRPIQRATAHNKDDEAIAVVGMACKVAGADDLDEFWSLLKEGKSQHCEIPQDRIHFDTHWREIDSSRKWYGNFIRDPDTFDHRFFKKSPREMTSTDPQQRWMMQIAYQAVEQSGYFNSENSERHIGCYIGVGCIDYEQNIACHPANAFSATGNLKSFIAGKISHFFGWTGPSMTIDTACSASAVAVHQACKAILNGDCNGAIAGGVTIMTSPLWFQNLAGGGFLSPTGNCKPFDADGDGYCRGEGIGAVYLKRLSKAVKDGNQILGLIPSTAVYQNQNCTPITVPNAESLSELFRHVTLKAGLDPKQISVVEAHGTGTPVGDPAEYESIRKVFGGPRADIVSLGSVKGLIGHTETASGIISLIKVLLMINEATIPPQASFKTLNPSIKSSPDDQMEVPRTLKPWATNFRAALINNYGASGSNASMVVTQMPEPPLIESEEIRSPGIKFPFRICGFDEQSLRHYVSRLRRYIGLRNSSSDSITGLSLADFALSAYRQSNRTLKQALFLCSNSVHELEEKLARFEKGDPSFTICSSIPATRPVVLCFGGQISTFVGLDLQLYKSTTILRKYLDECDVIARSKWTNSIYPHIFSREPISNIVLLQVILFSMQYSCAKVWMDCGVIPVAVVGHSFGELTALCISGALSLEDALTMVIGRATAICESWGSDSGAMMAVEGDVDRIHQLLQQSNQLSGSEATIACYNGPKSFTLAGSSQSIDAVAETISKNESFKSIRSKRLNVTNAFHSVLVEPLKEQLEAMGQSLSFKSPVIPIEFATQYESSAHTHLGLGYVAQHMRNPVYFNHAIQRLAKKYPSCIWLEAGSNSTIVGIASRALGNPNSSYFQPVNITSNKSLDLLTDSTLALWKQGLPVTFWPHHHSQTNEYRTVTLPPYQFAKARHWVDLKKPESKKLIAETSELSDDESALRLWSFIEYRDSAKTKARFRVNNTTELFKNYVKGHTIVQTAPLCPSTLQLSIVIDALMSLRSDSSKEKYYQPQLNGLENHAPLCIDPLQVLWLDLETTGGQDGPWNFQMVSNPLQEAVSVTLHVSGTLICRATDDMQLHRDFARYERLAGYQRCQELLGDANAPDIIQGRNIYRTFAEIVDYGEQYRGVQKIVGGENQSAGRIVKKHTEDVWLDPHLADCFCQVAGIFINCMTDTPKTEICISTGIEQWIRSPRLQSTDSQPGVWDILALHRRPSDKEYTSDVFIFDPRDGSLVEIILGIGYKRVPRLALGRMLSRLTSDLISSRAEPTSDSEFLTPSSTSIQGDTIPNGVSETNTHAKKRLEPSDRPEVSNNVRNILAGVSGLEPHEIQNDTSLANIGIDSLVGMELARDIEAMFKCTLDPATLMEVVDFLSLTKAIEKALGIEHNSTEESSEHDAVSVPLPAINRQYQSKVLTPKEDGKGQDSYFSSFTNAGPPNGIPTPQEEEMILQLPPTTILEAFADSKLETDNFIAQNKFGGYTKDVLPKQTELCIAHVVEAFQKLDCCLRTTKAGQVLHRVPHVPKHKMFADYIYQKLLCEEAHIIEFQGSQILRTGVPLPSKSTHELLSELVQNFPDHANDHQLIHLAGSKLAECFSGKADGVQLIFGSDKGRELVSGLYGRSPINVAFLKQMESFIQAIISKLPKDQGPLKILEMGAGTGGTTNGMAKLLDKLGVQVEYTFTDLSPSLVAAARKRFKNYSFMKFQMYDIEKAPPADLIQSQHIVIANNCVHATRSLYNSTRNIHQVLRLDGFLMILEMTDTLYWVDLAFGLLEGWWLFEDDRHHVVAHQNFWKQKMLAAGYGHVDWTEGQRPEADLQRIIIALASAPRYETFPTSPHLPSKIPDIDLAARQAVLDEYVRTYSDGLNSLPASLTSINTVATPSQPRAAVLITGATGSLGSHLVAHLAQLKIVSAVICINRRNNVLSAQERQRRAMESKGIKMNAEAWSKLKVFETDTAKPLLGLSKYEYDSLVQSITHIVHNAWPMSINRPIKGFEPQFRTMHNLIHLLREASSRHNNQVSFQFISSIATVGLYPVWSSKPLVPEQRMTIESILKSGYSEAKFVCERMLDETLHQLHVFDNRFRAMSVRIGQIAGSKTSGYWNTVEHLAFLLKSSQTLKVLPQFEGELSWCPVNDVAATLADLLFSSRKTYPIYHIENPVRQSWKEMIPLLADHLSIPRSSTVPLPEWVQLVRNFPVERKVENPAIQLIDFLDEHFIRMSCGGLVLDTKKAREHSSTLAKQEPISAELVGKYMDTWKAAGFLKD